MSVLDDDPAPPPASRLGRKLLLLVGVIAGIVAVWLTYGRDAAPASPPPTSAAARPSAPPPRKTVKPDAPAAAETSPRPEGPADDAPAAAAPAPAARTGVLRVRSDVPGASVFLDRQFLGTTPLDVDSLSPGAHRLNVSADGYEGHAQAVDIGDTPTEVSVRFKDVSVNASVAVVHKHAVGSCSGRLQADASGLRYETANAGDAFTLRFGEVEAFAVDYLKKNLRVKKRGGRTWNFEDPNGQADPLFVFHRDVEKARARLAAR